MRRKTQSKDLKRYITVENNKVLVKCKHCSSDDVVKKGYRNTENRGKQQRWICKTCNKSFTLDVGFYRMHNSVKIITASVDMYLSNLSSRKMRNQLNRHMNTRVSHVSVLDWVRKYVLKVHKFVSKKEPQLSGKLYIDETEIDREKNNDIFWCSVDWDTRFINATLYSPHAQNMKDAKEFMQRIKSTVIPKYIQSDGLPFYPKAFRTTFGKHGHVKKEIQHRVNNVSKTKKHNVRIETVFSKIKDRVYDFRGLKALWSTPILLAGIVLQHNFIEAHTTTGQIPSVLAGLDIKTGVNRWLSFIRLAACS